MVQLLSSRYALFLVLAMVSAKGASSFISVRLKRRSNCWWNTYIRRLSSRALRVATTQSVSSLTINTGRKNGVFDLPAPLSSMDSEPKSKLAAFESFDYLAHWYPAIWLRDLLPKKPTKVTLFDTDYIVARIPKENGTPADDDEVIALLDRCPHKSAALSEGRITKNGYIQCSYHGWSFNGTTGECMEIPQLVNMNGVMEVPISSRLCGTAVPAMVQQGMVYLFPGGNLEKALMATPPPQIPEMDRKDFKVTVLIRDMPVDWPILVENIMDPDHGLFVHHLPSFDWYSASKDFPLKIEEEFPDEGKGWHMTTRVDAVEKLRLVNQKRQNVSQRANPPTKIMAATAHFRAPYFATIGRRCKETGETQLLNGFWISPTGTGRSRLLIAFIARSPIAAPRWFTTILLNNFLDQDTYLIATQHQHVLKKEVEQIKYMLGKTAGGSIALMSNDVRKSLYNYRSPTERSSARIGKFWDATLHRAPNRIVSLFAMENRGELSITPSRQAVLDRNRYHLQVCPDSQGTVRACNTIQTTATFLSAALVAIRAYAALMVVSSSDSWFTRSIRNIPNFVVGSIVILSAIASVVANKVRREFYFKYDEKRHQQDLDKVPKKVWWEQDLCV